MAKRTVIKSLRLRSAPNGELVISSHKAQTIRPLLLDGVIPGYEIDRHGTAARTHIPADNVLHVDYDAEPEATAAAQQPQPQPQPQQAKR